jgi:hypothetical protein
MDFGIRLQNWKPLFFQFSIDKTEKDWAKPYKSIYQKKVHYMTDLLEQTIFKNTNL